MQTFILPHGKGKTVDSRGARLMAGSIQLVVSELTLCVLLPASSVEYIWNQWLNMSSAMRSINTM